MNESEFRATAQSLLSQVVAYVGRSQVESASVVANEIDGTAHLLIALHDESVSAVRRAIRQLSDVRRLFLGELAIDYEFVPSGTDVDERPKAKAQQFVCTV